MTSHALLPMYGRQFLQRVSANDKGLQHICSVQDQKIAQLHNKNNQIISNSESVHHNHISSDSIPSHTLQIPPTYSSVHRKSLHPLDLVGVPRAGDQSIPKAAKFLQPVSPALLQDCAHRSDSRFILPCNSAHSQMIHSKFVRFKDHKRQIQNPSTSFKIV